jgi:hypothetical protein
MRGYSSLNRGRTAKSITADGHVFIKAVGKILATTLLQLPIL